MSLIDRMRKQICVYWPLANIESGQVAFDDYGHPQYSGFVEMDCRWEDIMEEYLDSQGTRQLSRSKVFVGSDVQVGGVIMLGTSDDIIDEENPLQNDNAFEIKRFEKTPNLKATEYLRVVYV